MIPQDALVVSVSIVFPPTYYSRCWFLIGHVVLARMHTSVCAAP